jgi:hypothetical protein
MQHKGKKSLKEIWDEDQELDPSRIKQLQNENPQQA